MLQALTHEDPYIFGGEGYGMLDDGSLCNGLYGAYEGPCDTGDTPREPRDNTNCVGFPRTVPTANFEGAGANVPEPASLALVGLGLVALAWGGRQQRSRLRTT